MHWKNPTGVVQSFLFSWQFLLFFSLFNIEKINAGKKKYIIFVLRFNLFLPAPCPIGGDLVLSSNCELYAGEYSFNSISGKKIDYINLKMD